MLHSCQEATSENLDDRDLGFPLFALSRLAIYNEELHGPALMEQQQVVPPLPSLSIRPIRQRAGYRGT